MGYGDDTDGGDYGAMFSELAVEYAEMKRYVEHEKPYWLSLRHPRDGEMQWGLFNYFPEAHYQQALDDTYNQYRQQEYASAWGSPRDNDPIPDGGTEQLHTGRTRSTVYYWADPDTDAALYHTGVNDSEAIPFFGSVGEAENYLENLDESDPDTDYSRFSLYKARVKKQEDAVDVLMEQAGIADFDLDDD
ncbi:MAG: hypothetical protein ABEK12_02135 [Candidatus Nanohaloarchaea archaeon]